MSGNGHVYVELEQWMEINIPVLKLQVIQNRFEDWNTFNGIRGQQILTSTRFDWVKFCLEGFKGKRRSWIVIGIRWQAYAKHKVWKKEWEL